MMLKPRQPLILASASPRREILLRQLGLDFEVRPSYAEDGAVIELQHPAAYARAAAELKAEVIAAEISTGYVIGADTIVVQEGRILGKPEDDAHAMEILNHLQGHTHQVITGIAVIHVEDGVMLERTVEHVSTDVRMRRCTQGELEAYIATGEPKDKAGAYGIQGYGAMFIEGIIGDYFNVVGLPLCALVRMLAYLDAFE